MKITMILLYPEQNHAVLAKRQHDLLRFFRKQKVAAVPKRSRSSIRSILVATFD
jgi:hypothetical protein